MSSRRDWVGELEDTADFEFDLLAVTVGEAIAARMDELGVNRAELARKMGVSGPRVTQVLAGSDNLTLKTIVAVANALEAKVQFGLAPKYRQLRRPSTANWQEASRARPFVVDAALRPQLAA